MSGAFRCARSTQRQRDPHCHEHTNRSQTHGVWFSDFHSTANYCAATQPSSTALVVQRAQFDLIQMVRLIVPSRCVLFYVYGSQFEPYIVVSSCLLNLEEPLSQQTTDFGPQSSRESHRLDDVMVHIKYSI